MLPIKLLRTSSFRLTLLYAGLTSLSFALLFGVVYRATGSFMDRQIDATVATELAEVRDDAAGDSDKRAAIVRDLSARASGYFYLLQDRGGSVLAGNLPAMEPLPGIREWPGSAHRHDNRLQGIRGRGAVLENGGYLFVGMSTFQLHEMQEMVIRAFLSGLGAAMLVALIGGVLMSFGVLRRIESMSQASRDIVRGDLSRRIAVTGSADEFDHLAISLNVMLERIQALMDGLRQVSTDIAHDLRTPLTRLRQRIEAAQRRGGDAASLHEVLEASLGELDGILETFSALLRIAQIESGARRSGFAEVDLSEILRNVVEIYQPALEEKEQRLDYAIPEALAVHGDRELLMQMFANLLENAHWHSPAGAVIAIAAKTEGSQLEVVIADNGPGIPEELRSKVFQRFYRLERSRSTPGNGLGLSLAAAVAVLHEAVIDLRENAPGLRVTVRLPAKMGA